MSGLEGKVVAIDGETVRRSHRLGKGAIHLVSAYCGALRVSLGQVKTEAKSNEITAIPEPLEALLLKRAVVTIDAMGCQHKIAQKIVQGGADYVLAVKDNQPDLCSQALRELFNAHDGPGLKTVGFGEDQCRARVMSAARNFAILRRIVINLLRANPSTKVGAKTKRLKASGDDRYRAHILGLVAPQ